MSTQSFALRIRKTFPSAVFRMFLRFICSVPGPVQRRIALLFEGLTSIPISARVRSKAAIFISVSSSSYSV